MKWNLSTSEKRESVDREGETDGEAEKEPLGNICSDIYRGREKGREGGERKER